MPPPTRRRLKFSPDFAEALAFAATLHVDQMRKRPPVDPAAADDAPPIPYIAHLLGVCSLVIEHGADEATAIAALLHDALEDQVEHHGGDADAMARRIARRFGDDVLSIVMACSDQVGGDRGASWRARKQAYLDNLAAAATAVRLVACADKLHNGRSILADLRRHGAVVWSKFSAPRAEQLWYYRAAIGVFRAAGDVPLDLVEELERVVGEIEGE